MGVRAEEARNHRSQRPWSSRHDTLARSLARAANALIRGSWLAVVAISRCLVAEL
jgi:hypothetical protein